MKLYFYELYKLFSKKMFLFLFVLLFAANTALFIFTENSSNKNPSEENTYTNTAVTNSDAYNKELNKYKKMPKDKALKTIVQKCNAYKMCISISSLMSDSTLSSEELKDALMSIESSDPEAYKETVDIIKNNEDYKSKLFIYKKLKTIYEYLNKYDTFLNEMEQRAEKQLTFSIFADVGSFSYNNIQKTPKDFESLKGIELTADDYSGTEKGTQFNYTDLFVIATVFLMCVYIFSQERDKSLLLLIKSTENGQLSTAIAKILSLFTYIILTCILFYGSDIIISGFTYGFGDLNAFVQSIPSFMNCNLKITVLQYLILWLCCKSFTVITLGAIFSGIFLMFKNSAQIYSICAAVIVAEYALYIFVPSQSPINHFRYINIINFLDTKELLSNYLNLNFFTKPINLITVYIFFCLLLIIVFSSLSLFAFAKQKQIVTKINIPVIGKIKEKLFHIKGSVNIFSAEMFKLLIQEKVWIILVIALCFGINASMKTFSNFYSSIPEAIYHSYLSQMEGKIDSEKTEYIEKEQKYFDDLKKEQEQLYSIENPTREQKDRIENIDMIFDGKYKGFEKFSEQYEYLKEQNEKFGTEIYFIDEAKYGNIFTNSSNDWWQYIQTVIVLIIALGNVFAFEHKRNMSKLLKATPNGKYRLAAMKYFSAAIVSVITFIIFYLPNLIAFYRQYGFIIGDAPASSIRIFENAPHGMSLLGLLVFMYSIRFIILLSVAFIIVSLSELLESYFLTMTVSTVIFVFGGILLYGTNEARIFSQIGNGHTWLVILITVAALICAALSILLAISKHSGIKIKKVINNLCLRKGADINGTEN